MSSSRRLDELLRRLADSRASDLHLKPKRPPLVRLNGRLTPLDEPPLEPSEIVELLRPVIPDRLRPRMEQEMAVEFGYGLPGVSRFRGSVFYQRGTLAAVFRRVAFNFPSIEEWGLPPVLNDFSKLPQGLVLITGPTGSGKSSTLAALMRRIAETRAVHIVTIEDPIEFLIRDATASISQREVGTDTPGFSLALRNALRQDPDVIMVGETRDEETVRTVLTAAETGHLVFSTLHTNNAVQTIDRLISGFPETGHRQVRQQLSSVVEAIVSMQLLPRADGNGLAAAVEILRRTPQVSKLILRGDLEALQEEIESSVAYFKMQSMNQSLAALVVNGTITREAAMTVSANPTDLDLLLRRLFGIAADGEQLQGDAMAECTSDFSKILELQEIKRLYEELQERHTQELAAREQVIAELRQEIQQAGDHSTEEQQIGHLRQENELLAGQMETSRREYEAKLERLNVRVRELSSKLAAAQESATPEKRGLFRR